MLKVPAVDRPEGPERRRGELQHRHPPAGPAHANHFPQPGVGVGQVSQPERHRDDLKRVVGKRQPQGIGFQQSNAQRSRAGSSLVPTLCVETSRLGACATSLDGRRASDGAFPRRAWERDTRRRGGTSLGQLPTSVGRNPWPRWLPFPATPASTPAPGRRCPCKR